MRDLSMRRFARDLAGELFHLDTRLWRSIGTLLFEPGESARRAVDDESQSHQVVELDERARDSSTPRSLIHPVRLYLAANLLFFIIVPLLNTDQITILYNDLDVLEGLAPAYADVVAEEALAKEQDLVAYRAQLDAWIRSNQGALIAVLLPLLALPLWIMFRRERRYFLEHLLLSASFYTIFLLTLPLIGVTIRLLTGLGASSGALDSSAALVMILTPTFVWFAGLLLWLWRALARYYEAGPVKSLALSIPLCLVSLASFGAYAHLLFWIGVLALRTSS